MYTIKAHPYLIGMNAVMMAGTNTIHVSEELHTKINGKPGFEFKVQVFPANFFDTEPHMGIPITELKWSRQEA